MGAEYGLRITMENGVIKLFNMWPYCTIKAIFALLRRKLFLFPLSPSFRARNNYSTLTTSSKCVTRTYFYVFVEKKSSRFIYKQQQWTRSSSNSILLFIFFRVLLSDKLVREGTGWTI